MRQVSLKKRLLVLVLSAIALVWLTAALMTYFDARDELNEVLDAHLAQAASLLAAQSPHEIEEIDTDHVPLLHKYERRVAFQVWENGKVLRLHSINAPETPLAPSDHGFSTQRIDGRSWRVFSTWDESGHHLIHVAEQADTRARLSRGIAGYLIFPLLIALPVLALLLWWAIANALRPLNVLSEQLEQRAPDNLAALEPAAAPEEVLPLIERLNRLFVRIQHSMENERRFTADAAHELRTPVAAIKAQAQVARAARAEQERIHALDSAIAGCDRATHLIEQLLTLARLDAEQAPALEACALRKLASECIAELAPIALNQGIQLELADGEEAVVPGRPMLLRVLMRNLLDNAIRHTPAGTTVIVDIATRQGRICLAVSDNGPGLPPEELVRIAERFHRPAGTSASGSGLGLSIAKRIAEIHAAEFQVRAAVPHGLCVTVLFGAR